MNPATVIQGNSPVVLGLPHCGTWLPEPVFAKLNAHGQTLGDTDWHVDRLYEGLLPDATTVRANFHRYLIDPNRNPGGDSLYPGQNTTSLVPTTDFDGVPIWHELPTDTDIAERLTTYHRAYHAALEAELARVQQLHGVAILYDCHSIRSRAPFLFEGVLPDFNIGTNDGATCDHVLENQVVRICAKADGFSHVVNGRFKGGWTTRHYGRPETGIHAIQMELAQSTYLTKEVEGWPYDAGKANHLRIHLKAILDALTDQAPTLVSKLKG